jgi:hypothetical protein
VAFRVCLRLSLSLCALHVLAAIATAKAPTSSGEPTGSISNSAVDQLLSQTIGQSATWDLELPQLLIPWAGESAASLPTLVYLRVSGDYLSRRFERDVNRTKPVTDHILGTSIRGKSLTRGTTRLVLVPNDDHFAADIEFVGTVDSVTRGVNGPAILH